MYFKIIKETRGKETNWRLSHEPSDRCVGKYRLRRIAKQVVDTIKLELGDAASESDPVKLAALIGGHTSLFGYIRKADDFADYAAFCARQRELVAAEEALQHAKDRWLGVVFYYGEGSMRYGKEGKILAVEAIDPEDGEPERLVCNIAWEGGATTLGSSLYLESVIIGKAPADMPWSEIRRGHEWRARINRGIYCICKAGAQFILWNKDVPAGHKKLSEYNPVKLYPDLKTAKNGAIANAGLVVK